MGSKSVKWRNKQQETPHRCHMSTWEIITTDTPRQSIQMMDVLSPPAQTTATASLCPLGFTQGSKFIWVCKDLPDRSQEVAILWRQTTWGRGECGNVAVIS